MAPKLGDSRIQLEMRMLDVVYVGLTVAFFVTLAVLAKAVERLGGPEPAADSERPTADLTLTEAGR